MVWGVNMNPNKTERHNLPLLFSGSEIELLLRSRDSEFGEKSPYSENVYKVSFRCFWWLDELQVVRPLRSVKQLTEFHKVIWMLVLPVYLRKLV